LPRRARADYNARVPSPGERLIALIRAEPPRVARDVFIGSAHRGGKETGNYFVLCREQR